MQLQPVCGGGRWSEIFPHRNRRRRERKTRKNLLHLKMLSTFQDWPAAGTVTSNGNGNTPNALNILFKHFPIVPSLHAAVWFSQLQLSGIVCALFLDSILLLLYYLSFMSAYICESGTQGLRLDMLYVRCMHANEVATICEVSMICDAVDRIHCHMRNYWTYGAQCQRPPCARRDSATAATSNIYFPNKNRWQKRAERMFKRKRWDSLRRGWHRNAFGGGAAGRSKSIFWVEYHWSTPEKQWSVEVLGAQSISNVAMPRNQKIIKWCWRDHGIKYSWKLWWVVAKLAHVGCSSMNFR